MDKKNKKYPPYEHEKYDGRKRGDTMVPDKKKIVKLYIDVSFPVNNLKTKIVTKGKHNEAFWRTEFL